MVSQITVGSFAFLLNCVSAGQTSDSMTVPTQRLIYRWEDWGLILRLLSGPTGIELLDFFCSGIRFYTTFTNFSMKYLVMCKVYTDVGGIK